MFRQGLRKPFEGLDNYIKSAWSALVRRRRQSVVAYLEADPS